MSETMNTYAVRGSDFRRQLLATVSVMTLLGALCGASEAADSDSAPLWIELGGQLSRLDDGQETFAPHFLASRPSIFEPSQKFERPPLYSVDESGSIFFQPVDSNWIFSASVRFGRSTSNKNVHQQTYPADYVKYTANGGIGERAQAAAAKFADTSARTDESHLLLDFQVGRDVGLGMFGGNGSSRLNLGVRVAQFASRSNTILKSDPDWHFYHKYLQSQHKSIVLGQVYHSNSAKADAARSFHGIGPSISWNASAPFVGDPQKGELSLDWGLNAAILFGRQKTRVHHQTTALYHGHKYVSPPRKTLYHSSHNPPERIRSITVPNVGGVAGLSFRIENFKVSAGYRADLFFGAMDGGIDTARKENVGFFGPFASVSVGLGG